MDGFAHLASGALIGRLVRPTGTQWPAFALFGAAAGMSPDLDAPLALLGPEAWAKHHQVYTHSLLGVLWVPALLASLPFSSAAWPTRYLLAVAGWSLHVALDFVANWPIAILWPVSDARFSMHLLSLDFSWRLDMLLVAGLAATLWDRAMPRARLICAITALAMAAWLLLGLPT